MNNLKQRGATFVQRASAKIAGFKALHKRLEKKIIVSGKSQSTLTNYMRCTAHLASYFNCIPTKLDLEQIEDYILYLKQKEPSEAGFKLTVYGLRFLFRYEGLDDRAIRRHRPKCQQVPRERWIFAREAEKRSWFPHRIFT